MQNITQYSDQELSLLVFNDEYLYSKRHNRALLIELIDDSFIYNKEQMDELVSDLNDEDSENED